MLRSRGPSSPLGLHSITPNTFAVALILSLTPVTLIGIAVLRWGRRS